MKQPLVTIAIPTYNRADNYLVQTLKCAIQQTYENIEILVSDNCSTDNTETVVRTYTDPRIKYFRQKSNIGRQDNSNFLLQQAKGDYFHLFHDDDLVDKDFIETCMNGAGHNTGYGVIMTGSRAIDEMGREIRHKKNHCDGLSIEDLILSWYEGKVNIYLCCTLFGTDTLRDIGGFEEKYNHYDDVAANFKCSSKNGRIDIQAVKAGFRKHSGSITSTAIPDEWCDNASNLLDLTCTLSAEKSGEIRNIGLRTSSKNMYRYASNIESKLERLITFFRIYKHFRYKQSPPWKYYKELFL